MTVYNDYNIFGSLKYKATVYDGIATIVRHEYDDQNRLKNVRTPLISLPTIRTIRRELAGFRPTVHMR